METLETHLNLPSMIKRRSRQQTSRASPVSSKLLADKVRGECPTNLDESLWKGSPVVRVKHSPTKESRCLGKSLSLCSSCQALTYNWDGGLGITFLHYSRLSLPWLGRWLSQESSTARAQWRSEFRSQHPHESKAQGHTISQCWGVGAGVEQRQADSWSLLANRSSQSSLFPLL